MVKMLNENEPTLRVILEKFDIVKLAKYYPGRKGLLSPLEITTYFSLIDQLESFPYSERHFSDQYNESMQILQTKGIMRNAYFAKRDNKVDDQNPLIIVYMRYRLCDDLFITAYDGGVEKRLHLLRRRGIATSKKLISEDPVSQITRGLGLVQMVKGIDNYDPSELSLTTAKGKVFHRYY